MEREPFLPQQQSDEAPSPASSSPIWTNPLAMLAVGLVIGVLIGYGVRPLVTPRSLFGSPAASAQDADPPPASLDPTPVNPASLPGSLEDLTARVRHFKGNPNAPVTIIEFGDFQ